MSDYILDFSGEMLDDTIRKVQAGYILPKDTVSITENGTGINVKRFAFADVNVPQGLTRYNSGTFVDNNTNKYVNDFSLNVGFKPKVFVIHNDAGIIYSAASPILCSIFICDDNYTITNKYTVYLYDNGGSYMGSRSGSSANTLKPTSNGVSGNSGTKSMFFPKGKQYIWYAWG